MKRVVLVFLILGLFILSSCVKPDTFVPEMTNAELELEFVKSYGNIGTWMNGTVIDSNGYVYIGTTRVMMVFVFDGANPFFTSWGTPGTNDGELDDITGMTIDKNDVIYISSGSSDRVQKFSTTGTWIETITHANLDNPGDLAVDDKGNIFVVSRNTDSIVKFDKDGNYLTEWGGTGTGNGKFNNICYITLDDDGNLYVSDRDQDSIQKFSNSGKFLLKFGTSGLGEGQLSVPQDIALDENGYIYVVDAERDKILKFNGGGAFIQEFGESGTTEEYQLREPWQVYIFGKRFIIIDAVADNKVKVFKQK